jgi:hypothetical protein
MTTTTAGSNTWSPLQKIAFRYFFLFFPLYIFFNPNGVLPFSDALADIYLTPFHVLIPWLAKHILHLPKAVTIFTNGSGDTTYDYLVILFMVVVAAIGTLIWSITGRNTKNYHKLLYWLVTIVRYYIAITMITYGSVKVIKLQFPTPSLSKLIEPLGNMSPMGLAWNYIGYSTAFNYFTGFAELTCGILLFFRKTTTLGAVLSLVVAGNIMAINYCYDVPVKLLSTILVVMSLFLLIRDSGRLISFFFLNKDAKPSNLTPHRFRARWKNITLTTVKYVLVFYVVFGDLYSAVQSESLYGAKAKKPPLYGLYNVTSFVRNKDTLPPLTTDTTRWNKLIVSRYKGFAQVNYMNDTVRYLNFKTDTIKKIITISTEADTLHKFKFNYKIVKPDVLVLKGLWKKDSIHIQLKRYDESRFPLLQRGFHFVNEYPNNR